MITFEFRAKFYCLHCTGGNFMSKINIIQNAIKELEGGSFQKLFVRIYIKSINLKIYKL